METKDTLNLRTYTNAFNEDESALVSEDTKIVLLCGDYDNNHIDDKIEGFLEGLDFCGIEYKLHEDITVDEKDYMYFVIGFQS